MSSQIIEVNGTEYEFPADMPDDEIKTALNKELGLPPPEHDFSAMEMVKNIPGSAWSEISDLASAIASPVDTLGGMYDLARGGMSHAMGWDDPAEEQASQFANFYKERYGDWNNFKRALEKDPVGVLGDATAALGGAGAGLRGAAKVGAGAGAKTAGDVLGKVAAAADPVMLLNNAPLAALANKRAIRETPSGLYQAATGLDAPDADLLLRERVLPDPEGVQKIADQKANLEGRLMEEINQSDAKIPASVLMENLDARRAQVAGTPDPNRATDMRTLQRINRQKREGLGITDDSMPMLDMAEVQDIKQGAYERAYDVTEPTSEVGKAQKARVKARNLRKQADVDIGRAAKEEIERVVPEAAGINEQIGQYSRVLPRLQDITDKLQKGKYKFQVGEGVIPGSLGAATAANIGPGAGAAVAAGGMGLAYLNRPQRKMKMAQMLQNFAEKDNWGGLASGPNIQAFLAALREAEEDKQNPLLLGM